MKKAVFFVILAMVVIGFCAAQNANDAQRIVGTWTQASRGFDCDVGTLWVFNANGTGTYGGKDFNYGISASGEILITGFNAIKLFMSPDGKRMFLSSIMFQKK